MTYVFDTTTTSNALLNSSKLLDEISLSAVSVTAERIDTEETTATIYFDAPPTPADVTTLDALVAAHDGSPDPAAAIPPKDTDGAPIIKTKIVPSGWSYQLRGFDFGIGDFDGVVSIDAFGNAKMDYTLAHYDAQDAAITDQAGMTNAVKTIMSWEPTHDYAIVGGVVYQDVDPTQDIRLGVVAAPYIPKASGGSVEFGMGINLKHVGHTGSVQMDGRNPKILTYDATYHTSLLQVILIYDAGTNHTFHLLFEAFNPPGV